MTFWLIVIALPFLLGAAVRTLFWKKEKGWIVTAVAAGLALAAVIVAVVVPSHGSEANGMRAYMAVCLLLGALLAAGVIRLIRRKQK